MKSFHSTKWALLALIILLGPAPTASAAEKAADEKPGIEGLFIQGHYIAIGGAIRGSQSKSAFYRSKCRVFEKKGKILMSRKFGNKKEVAEIVFKPAFEGPDSWDVEFPVAGIRISYLLMFYHDNHPLLTGEVSKKDKTGVYQFSGLETAYPNIYPAPHAENPPP